MISVICLGEAMLELSRAGDGWRMAAAGDTLNTAVHLARAGLAVDYFTAIGTDPFSDKLAASWAIEGVGSSFVLRHPTRGCGLYAVTTDAAGERSFTYWRDSSAAREMFVLEAATAARKRAGSCDLLSFSLISLAILPDDGREAVLALARQVREAGGKVVFDGNFRPRLWSDTHAARDWADRAIAVADYGFPTLEDEVALRELITAGQVAAHWQALGCGETVVKLGSEGCRLAGGELVVPAAQLKPVDTSGAGDAFNAGYLAARLTGGTERDAAAEGNRVAGWTIMRRGAIPPRDPLY